MYLKNSKIIVIKIGSSLLIDKNRKIRRRWLFEFTKDIKFLRKYIGDIKETMRWLGAHDSNNDALLEIPEAGDWTDLFGGSYNILYDEILWYRSNVCFGRMLEMLGDYDEAGEYIRWSQVIKKEILQNFWPSTQQKLLQTVSFAERQFTLGDTSYLIQQTS